MGQIRVLPDSVINTIAAGEVVERPASVVKELMENALDAGAGSISIRLEGGGRGLIEVRDDGGGMDPDDAVSSLERHATSKLSPGTGLDSIATLGFRGEALPSIAAVSRLSLATSDGVHGTRVEVEGGVIRSSEPAAHPRGTTIIVRDLFFNTPARRRFLRSPSTESGHIMELFTTIALSRPGLKLRLRHGSRRLFDLPPATDVRSRLAQLEGAEAARQAAEIALEADGCSVTGFILAGSRGSRDRSRRLLVNDRVVRDRLVLRALSRAVEEALPSGTPTTCFLSLRIPGDRVDVNVHPAKAEVRFREPGAVFRAIQAAVTGALQGARPLREGPGPSGPRATPEGHREGDGRTVSEAREAVAGAAEEWMRSRAGATALWAAARTARAEGEASGEVGAPAALRGDPVVVGHYRSGYILAQDQEGLLIVDQHAAHERILFEELGEREAAGGESVQALLFPRTVQLPAALRGQAERLVEDLASLGFQAEEFGEGTLVVRTVPAPLAGADPESLVLEIVSSAAGPAAEGSAGEGIEARRRRMVATAACHAAVKVPAHLTGEKIRWIVERLLQCRSPLQCPHGRPTILRWSHRELERRFGRP